MKNKWMLAITLLALASVIVAACGPIGGSGEKTIYVGPNQVECEGVAPQTCLLVKEDPEDEWTLFYDRIEGFEYEAGYEYELRIVEEKVDNPPADASSLRWTLVEVVSKTRSLEGTTWVLETYLNSEGMLASVLPDSQSTARFEDGKVGGSASCNSYFGDYRLHGDDKISVNVMGMTEMYCAPEALMAQETDVLAALDGAASYVIVEDKLQFEDIGGNEILVYSAQKSASLVGTMWQLTGYNNGKGGFSSVLAGTEITAIFSEDGQLGGTAGCNSYTSSYEVSGNHLTVGPVASTMMMCPGPDGVMEQEQAYLAALESATTYEIDGNSLTIADATGQVMLGYTVSKAASLVDTRWLLTGYNNGKGGFSSVLRDTEITAVFGLDGSLTGSAGCNNYTSSYEVEDASASGGAMSVGMPASTMMMCPGPQGIMEQETAYLAALQSTAAYEIMGDQLTITGADGTRLLTYEVSEPGSLMETVWVATGYNNGKGGVVSLVIGTEITAMFGVDGTLSGSAGCNNYNAAYESEASPSGAEGTMAIGPAATTRKFCSEPEGTMDQESQYLAALQMANVYRIDGDRLQLRTNEGSLVADYIAQAQAGDLGEEPLANMEYKSEWTPSGTVQLVDGEYREAAAPGSATEIVIKLTDHAAHGQLNGQDAVVVVLVTDPGGSGTFYDLAVVMEQGGKPVNVATTSLGDRVQIQALTIAGNEIVVEMVNQGPEDPMCCPTQQVVQTYALEGNELVQTSSRVVE